MFIYDPGLDKQVQSIHLICVDLVVTTYKLNRYSILSVIIYRNSVKAGNNVYWIFREQLN